MTRRSVSTASMIDQVGTAIATADGADLGATDERVISSNVPPGHPTARVMR